MHTFRTISITLVILLFLGFTSTEALAKRHYDRGDSSGGTNTESTISYRSVRYLAKTYLDDFQAVDPNITYRDLTSYINSLKAKSVSEAETALQAYLISLQGAPVNQPPSISGSSTAIVNEGEAYQFTPSASDPEGDSLVFTIVNKPLWAVFDTTTGSLSGTPDYDAAGLYDGVQISVSDGESTSTLPVFSVTVNDVAQDPVEPDPVVTAGPPTLQTAVVNGENIVLSWIQENAVPEGGYDTFIDDVDTNTQYRTTATTASISGLDVTQSHCFSVESRYTDTGEFFSSNQVCSDAQQSPNQSPVISGTPSTTTEVGESYSFTPTASDPDGDQLVFTATNLPGWASVDSTTGRVSGVPGEQDAGSYPGITILVSDGSSSDSLAPFTLLVEAAPSQTQASATLTWSAPSTRTDGTSLSMSEIDGYRIYMGESESDLTPVMDINDNTLTVYTFTNLSAGTYYFSVTAYDMDGIESGFSNIISRSAL